ncbi:MAG TPA: hypothetical protein PLS69_06830 [Terricaulis sp.]|nr:hypothetical protein [Terricaulis sp.]HRP10400.1 hypothetical protein [Terricaulis sp.]
MPELAEPFVVLRGVLDQGDIAVLREACKDRLNRDGIPCFAMLDRQQTPTYQKIVRVLTEAIGEQLNYLNDFYIYTDESFKTNWHMDTELFTFESAINAWILLSPDSVNGPLGFIGDVNVDADRYFHSVKIEGDDATFRNYRTGKSEQRSLAEIEANQRRTPQIELGDILVINPKLFHRTTIDAPKHAFALKFVYGSARRGCLSPKQVPSMLWPEVKTFNDVINASPTWDHFLDGLRQQLTTEDGRAKLSSGFYPEKFPLYREKVQAL